MGLWHELRALPFEEQKRRLRGSFFHSTALFDLLRERSREEGRRERRRGVEVAELALVSLEGCEEVFGERIHELRALGWAWLGNAHRLALDFSAAGAAFDRSDEHWSEAKARREPRVAAEIDFLKGTLRMFQRRYDDALRLADRSRSLFELEGDHQGQARALIQRASILGYSGRLEASIVALEEAEVILDNEKEQLYLVYSLAGNLANSLAKLGRYHPASEYLAQAENHLSQLDLPLGRLKLAWMEADIKLGMGEIQAAEELYTAARSGYADAKEWSSFALTGLDLAILFSQNGAWADVMELASSAVPILGSLRLHPETLAVVKLLAKAVQAEDVQANLLLEVREHLQQDPLVRLA